MNGDSNIQQNTIIFRMGEETGIVIEKTKEQFEHSLFKEQYKQAFSLIDGILARTTKANPSDEIDENISNVIAFCGDRGEGKTSALETVRGILLKKDIFKEAVSANLFSENTQLDASKFKVLNLVDPAFFDKEHNLLELLLGQMYAEITDDDKKKAKENDYEDMCASHNVALRNTLMQDFEDVRHSLEIIRKTSEKNAYDNLEQVDELAAGVALKKKVRCLLKNYAQYFQKERVLVCIDDLDLNISEGYKMAEEIRKYLSTPSICIVMMAIKAEQMEEVVQSYLRENTSKIIVDGTITNMANRYVTKLLPQGNRVWMPQGESVVERKVQLYNGEKLEDEFSSVKDAVVKLIYRKTRYIFVNGRNISPIVPTNLRSVRHLIRLLWNMPNVANEQNKSTFKNYFYYTWTKNLQDEDAKFVYELVKSEDLVAINKSVLMHLRTNLLKAQKKDYEFDGMLGKLLNPMNTMQNVSLGDVFYVLNQLDNTATSLSDRNLVFFLRAYYSIKLYETYDIISASPEQLFVEQKDSEPSIFKYDEELRHLNMLQRFVNGSYFTYEPGTLLRNEQYGDARDKRQINGKALQALFTRINTEADKDKKLKALRLAEFFVLTTRYPVYAKEDVDYNRTMSRRSYYESFTSSNNLIVFDVLSIFYNLINVKFTYNRWNDIFGKDFYDYAKDEPGSILRKMLLNCETNHETSESLLDSDMHSLLSEAVIRFSEVQMAILDHLTNNRNKDKEGSNTISLRKLYESIKGLGIKIYSVKEDEDNGHPIDFYFLDELIELLKNVDPKEFDGIFTPQGSQFNAAMYTYFATILDGKTYPITGKIISNRIKQFSANIYEDCGGDAYWDKLLGTRRKYNSLQSIIAAVNNDSTFKEKVIEDFLKSIRSTN